MFRLAVDDSIELRQLEPSHAAELFRTIDNNREHLRQWLPWVDASRSVADTIAFIEAKLEDSAANNGFHAGIWCRGRLGGVIGLHGIDWTNRTTSIGFWLSREYTGRGIVTKATLALATYVFKELGLHRVEIRCAAENVKSRRIPERLGFRKEGCLRQGEFLYDRHVDLIVYGLLADELVTSG